MYRCYLSANYTGTGQSECEEGTRVHQIYCEESKATNCPQGTVSQGTVSQKISFDVV